MSALEVGSREGVSDLRSIPRTPGDRTAGQNRVRPPCSPAGWDAFASQPGVRRKGSKMNDTGAIVFLILIIFLIVASSWIGGIIRNCNQIGDYFDDHWRDD